MLSKNVLKERIIKLESMAWLWGNGNPESISFTQMDLMRDDPIIKIGLAMIKMPILTGEYVVNSKSTELRELTEHYVTDRFFFSTLTQALLGLEYGFSVQEKVWMEEDKLLVPRSYTHPRPENVTILLNKDYGGYDGIRVNRKDVPAEKTWLYTFGFEFDNYYGKSILHGIYRAWYDEQVVNLAMLRHSEFHASPVYALYFPEERDENDNFIHLADAKKVLADIPYRKEIAIPHSVDPNTGKKTWEFQLLTAGQANPEGYEPIIQYCNKKKLLGLLVPPQVVDREAATGSYAEGEVKLDTALMLIEGIQKQVEDDYNKHIIDQFIQYNFGEVKDEVKVRFLPLERNKQKLIMDTVSKIAATRADELTVGLANQYLQEMLAGEVENKVLPEKGVKEVPQEER